MSEREFEAYLNLLSRTLGLSVSQRDRIARELRDHMEARLDELIQQGISHDDAVITALDEFGDVECLAQDLKCNTRSPFRRTVMRISLIGTCAAAVLLAVFVHYNSVWTTATPSGTPLLHVLPAGELAGPMAKPAKHPAFVLDEEVEFVERSRPVVYLDQEVHLLTAFKLRFSHEVPKITDQDGPLLPEGVEVQNLMADPGPGTGARPLYGVMSVTSVSFDDVTYRVNVALLDKDGGLLGTAFTKVHVPRAWVGQTMTMFQTYLLDFGPSLAWGRVVRFDVSIAEMPVLTPEEWMATAEEPAEQEVAVDVAALTLDPRAFWSGFPVVDKEISGVRAEETALWSAIEALDQLSNEYQTLLEMEHSKGKQLDLSRVDWLKKEIQTINEARARLDRLYMTLAISRC